jgi:hypothetical protein
VPESPLILKRVSASGFSLIRRVERRRLSDVLTDGVVVRRIFKVHAAPVGVPGLRTLAFGHHESLADARLRADARGRDGGVREVMAAGVKGADRLASGSIQNDSGLPQGPVGASGAS